MTADVKIETSVFAPSGYSFVARKLLLELDKLGLDIHLVDKHVDKMRLNISEEEMEIFTNMLENTSTKNVPLLRYGTPVVFNTPPTHKRNILKFVWENDRLPPLWKQLIQVYDEYITINDFVKEMIEEAVGKGTKPIHIVPHGVDTNVFYPDEPMLKKDDKDRFVFLSLGQWIIRKGFKELLMAYFSEFTGNDQVNLIIKTYGMDNSFSTMVDIQNSIKRLSYNMGLKNPPHIMVIGQMFNQEGLRKLYNSADCFVLPSKGESWCLPYMQSMACGVPAIAQEYGGHLTYMNRKNSLLVKPEKMEISNGDGWYSPLNGLKWAIPSVDNLRKVMRYAYEHPDICKELGERARKDVQQWSWEKAGKKLYDVIVNEEKEEKK